MRTLRRRRIASVRVFMTDHIPDFAIVLGLSLFSLAVLLAVGVITPTRQYR